MPSLGAAVTGFGFVVVVFMNTCGFFLPIGSIPPWFIWLTWTSVYVSRPLPNPSKP